MIKMKSILKEGYAWERESGKPLPTLKSVAEKYEKNLKEQALDAELKIEEAYDSHNMSALIELYHQYKDGGMSKEIFYQLLKILSPDEREELMGYIKTRRDSEKYDLPDESPMDYSEDFMEEAYDAKGVKEAEDKADKDYDGDGKVESGADEYLGSRDKAIKKSMKEEEDKCESCGKPKDECECEGHEHSEGADESALNMGSLEESFWGRVRGNLHGHEYILRETFRK